MRQIGALMDRWYEEWQMRDRLHARTAIAFGGGKVDDVLMFKDEPDEPDQAVVGSRIHDTMQRLAGTNT